MSLLNAWVMQDQAVIAVDTDGISQAGEHRPMSKVLAVPHLPAALAFRGQSALSASVLQRCIGGFGTFDELHVALPGILDDEDRLLLETQKVAVGGETGNEVFAAGWSHARGRMVGYSFAKRGDMLCFSALESQGCISPWDEGSMANIPKTADAVKRLARAQVRWMRGQIGLGGGTLIVCRLRKDAVTMDHVASLN